MSQPENNDTASVIREAIRAKRERKSGLVDDIAALEAALIADIETFDLDAAERRARREQNTGAGAGMSDPTLVFPEIVPTDPPPRPGAGGHDNRAAIAAVAQSAAGTLLDQLRHQAEVRQREMHSALAERSTTNEAIDHALRHLFFYLHELVQQLNIVKPAIARQFPLLDNHLLADLSWHEGFADYRTQSQSAGALVELVSFSYRLTGTGLPPIERDGPGVERFRSALFDFGLPFTCKEYKNERSYVERAEFQVSSEISVSARWRADFARGLLLLETRNLERLGSAVYTLRPTAVDEALLEEFGRLVLGQPSQFRDLARR
ncbi:MAG TPA: hypothetical protein VF096_04720 [Azonexus sp.]